MIPLRRQEFCHKIGNGACWTHYFYLIRICLSLAHRHLVVVSSKHFSENSSHAIGFLKSKRNGNIFWHILISFSSRIPFSSSRDIWVFANLFFDSTFFLPDKKEWFSLHPSKLCEQSVSLASSRRDNDNFHKIHGVISVFLELLGSFRWHFIQKNLMIRSESYRWFGEKGKGISISQSGGKHFLSFVTLWYLFVSCSVLH